MILNSAKKNIVIGYNQITSDAPRAPSLWLGSSVNNLEKELDEKLQNCISNSWPFSFD